MVTFKNCLKGASAAVAAALISAALLVSAAPAEAQALGFMAETSQYVEEIKDYVADVAEKATERAEKKAAEKKAKAQKKADRKAVVKEALKHKGVPYVYGGTTPSGFDCSGFTRWVYEHALGRSLPRTAAEQSALGTSVSMDSLVAGDLLFWGSGSGVYHVGIYVGDGEYIHASTGSGQVKVSNFDYHAPSFAKRLL
ncbi:C40 family peptidase [Adlercreutzia equolifaciens]|uniref:C40 family peptidase n=1 Tax=Adlercreutzia equolifaciens TaxID=446660 RepID=UPI0023B08D6D|nr:C40 family peptidase [Adlercreutzia equolifaciens]MDE8702792.1 C40 family peptidase [Adlercreutzia equolifaciens]